MGWRNDSRRDRCWRRRCSNVHSRCGHDRDIHQNDCRLVPVNVAGWTADAESDGNVAVAIDAVGCFESYPLVEIDGRAAEGDRMRSMRCWHDYRRARGTVLVVTMMVTALATIPIWEQPASAASEVWAAKLPDDHGIALLSAFGGVGVVGSYSTDGGRLDGLGPAGLSWSQHPSVGANTNVLVLRQATFARFTTSRSARSWALRLRQAM